MQLNLECGEPKFVSFFVVRTASTLSTEIRVHFETTVYRVPRKKERDKPIGAYFFA
jgi:hypothetical protein